MLTLGLGALMLAANVILERMLMSMGTKILLVPGLADFMPIWNRGVSFSLFTQDSGTGPIC